MNAFELTCSDCGPVEVVTLDAIHRRTAKPPLRCPKCNGPVVVDVIHDDEAPAPTGSSSRLPTSTGR